MNNNNNNNNGLNEPLILVRTPSMNRHTPPRQAFSIRDRTETEEAVAVQAMMENNNNNNSDDSAANVASSSSPLMMMLPLLLLAVQEEKERDRQQQTLHLLGRPYAATTAFYQSLAAAVLLGVGVGLSCLLFLVVARAGLGLWTATVPSSRSFAAAADSSWHLVIATSGGILTGLVYVLLPRAPVIGAVRTVAHSVTDLKATGPLQSLTVVLAGCLALVTGAPVGPEQALGAIGAAWAGALSQFCKVPRRTEAVWMQAALAAALGGLVPVPLLGPTLLHELAVTARSDRLTVDAVVAAEGPAEDTDPTTGVVSTTAAAESSLQPENHDYIEGFTLLTVAAVTASLAIRWIHPGGALFLSDLQPVSNDFATWHLAAAVPLGIVCGAVGSAVVVLTAVFRRMRQRSSQAMVRLGAPVWLVSILFPAVAGLVHGLLSAAHPYATGTGLAFFRHAWNAAAQKETLLSVGDLCRTACARVLGLSVSLGFGLIGGSILPTVVVGLCVGLALSLSISVLPLSLAVPCCVAACPVAFLPAPVTAVITVALIMGCSADQTGPILISSLVAFTITGGTGVLRHIGERQFSASAIEDADGPELVPPDPQSDDEILQGVRSAIFGGV